MKRYIPVYKRSPCKFIKYETQPFDDGAGHTGMVRIAHFIDKNAKLQQMVVQITWDK